MTTRLLLVCLIATAFLSLPARADEEDAAGAGASALVSTLPVQHKSLAENITAYGTVQPDPAEVHSVAMPHEGIVAKVFVRAGQAVKTGEPIVAIENSAGATAQYEQAKAALDYARQDLDRTQSLLKDQLATREQVAQAEKALGTAQSEFDRMVKLGSDKSSEILRAAFDGVVTDVAAKPGDHLQADAVTVTIGSRDLLVVALGVEPEDVARITPGTPVHLTSPLDPTVAIDAKISVMHDMVNATTHLVDGVVQLTPPATDKLVLGMTVAGRIELPSPPGAVVPRAALMEDADGTFVFTVDGGVAHRQTVSVVAESESEAAVKETLAEQTKVVVTGNAALKDGMKVREAATQGGDK